MNVLQNRELTAVFFVAVVTTVVPVIAPRSLLDAALRSIAPELIQSTSWLHIIFASFLISTIPAIQVTIALLFFRYTKFRCGSNAPEVIWLAFSICYNINVFYHFFAFANLFFFYKLSKKN